MDFFEESTNKGRNMFWITPAFGPYKIDQLTFTNSASGLRVYRDGGEFGRGANVVTTNSKANITLSERCNDWEGADISLSNYNYYLIYTIENYTHDTGHQLHTGIPRESTSTGDCSCHIGSYSPSQGKLMLDQRGHVKFISKWSIPNTAGTFTLNANLSKTFDGRKFSTDANMIRMFGYQLRPLNGASGDGQMYLIKPCDSNDHHFNAFNFYDRYMNSCSIIILGSAFDHFLQNIYEENPDKIGYKFLFTSASLKKGGFLI